jgi:hypothetical protein
MAQLGLGEQLQLQGTSILRVQQPFLIPKIGPDRYLDAASALYKALRVYPVAMELLMIYEQSLKPEVFGLVMRMTSMEVSTSNSPLGREMPGFAPEPLEEQPISGLRSSATSDTSFKDWEKLAESINEPL